MGEGCNLRTLSAHPASAQSRGWTTIPSSLHGRHLASCRLGPSGNCSPRALRGGSLECVCPHARRGAVWSPRALPSAPESRLPPGEQSGRLRPGAGSEVLAEEESGADTPARNAVGSPRLAAVPRLHPPPHALQSRRGVGASPGSSSTSGRGEAVGRDAPLPSLNSPANVDHAPHQVLARIHACHSGCKPRPWQATPCGHAPDHRLLPRVSRSPRPRPHASPLGLQRHRRLLGRRSAL